jgi:hypothetical protein
MIPPLDADGFLPTGVHWAELPEIWNRFGLNDHRRRLLNGFEAALAIFSAAGCRSVYLDGSFVTATEFPNDYDACWDAVGVDVGALDPVLLSFDNLRAAQKGKYLGEFFPAHVRAEATSPYRTFFQFFQVDKASGNVKGIIGIKLVRII